MSDIVDIAELRKAFQDKTKAKDLKAFVTSQQNIIELLLKEKEHLQEKLKSAEKLLTDISSGVLMLPMTKEESICKEQLSILKQKSEQRPLSLEDVKIFDILVKNLKLIQEGNKQESKNDFRDVEEISLVAIAAGPDKSI